MEPGVYTISCRSRGPSCAALRPPAFRSIELVLRPLGQHVRVWRVSTNGRRRAACATTCAIGSTAVNTRRHSKRGVSAATMSKHRNVLSQICGSEIRSGAMRANPVDGIRIAKSPTRTRRFLTPVEVEALAREITNPPPHVSLPYDTPRDELGLLIHFLAFSGLLIGEAFGLQVCDLDFDGGRAEVQRTASETSDVVTIQHPKSGSVRRVPLPGSLAHDLRLLCGQRARDAYV